MATRYGRTFRTRRGRFGRYKYVNGRRVSFVPHARRDTKKYRRQSNFRYYRRTYQRRY